MATGELQVSTSGYNGTGNNGDINTMRLVFNAATKVLGVWMYFVVGNGGATTSTECAIIADVNGNVIARGPATAVTNNAAWSYLPFNSAVSVSANTDYYVGCGFLSSNSRYVEGYNQPSLVSNIIDGVSFTVYNTQRSSTTGGASSASYVGAISTNAYTMSIGVRVQTNSPPNAPSLTGPGSINTLGFTVNWTFSDPDPGDTQGWRQYMISSTTNFATTDTGYGDTGQVATASTSFSDSRSKGTWYVRVRVWDNIGAVSPWSNVITINTNQPPNAPNITSPTADQNINTRTPTITWTFSDPDAGDTQSAFLIQTVNNAYTAVLWDSGWLTGAQTSYALPAAAITADGPLYVRMQVKDSSGAINTANGTGGGDVAFGNRHFIVDTVAPTATSVIGTQYVTTAPGSTYRMWAYGVTDPAPASGVQIVRFPTGLNGTNFAWFDGTKNGSTTDWYCDIPISSVSSGGPEGRYQSDIYAYDVAGNNRMIGSSSTYVDRTAPVITSVSGQQYIKANAATVWANGVTDANGIDHVSVYAVRPDASYYLLGNATRNGSTNDYSWNITDCTIDGNWGYDFRAYDPSGNVVGPTTARVFRDTVVPNATTPSATYVTTTATFTWGSFVDPSPSSGYQSTQVYVDLWNGTVWNAISGSPFSVGNVTTYSVSGLTQGGLYRVAIVFNDLSSNASTATYTQFTTKKQIGTYTRANVSVPIYDPASGVISKAVRIQTAAGLGCFELVPITDPNASPMRVRTPSGLKAVSK